MIHHLLSLVAVAYAMLTGEGQLYTFMVLISETTTPGINLRWWFAINKLSSEIGFDLDFRICSFLFLRKVFFFFFPTLRRYLDTAGMKKSKAYLINGVVIFFAWLVSQNIWLLYISFEACSITMESSEHSNLTLCISYVSG